MKYRKLVTILLALAMMLAFMPAMVFANESAANTADLENEELAVKTEEPAADNEVTDESSEKIPSEVDKTLLQSSEGEGLDNGVHAETDPVDFNLWVGDVHVNSDNCVDIANASKEASGKVKGNVSYKGNNEKGTLTLEDAEITAEGTDSEVIHANGIDLTIKVVGNNCKLNQPGSKDAIKVYNSSLTICGDGVLNVEGADAGIVAESLLQIEGVTLILDGTEYDLLAAGEGIKFEHAIVTADNHNGISGMFFVKDVQINDSKLSFTNTSWLVGDLSINRSKVSLEGASLIAYGKMELRNSGSGKYSTRLEVKQTASGQDLPVEPVDPIPVPLDGDAAPFTVGTLDLTDTHDLPAIVGDGIERYDGLEIVVPQGGREGAYRPGETIFDGDKIADHVVIAPSADPLMATIKATGKKAVNVTWNAIADADGYDIFFARCNTKKKKYTCTYAGSVNGSNSTSWTKADLNKRTPYKVYVMAYTLRGGEKTYIAKSPTVHAYTGGYSSKYTNPKSVKVKKTKVSVKKGKTYKIRASVRKLKKGRRLINSAHAPKLRYLSSNTSVATVTKYGKIKGKSAGTCKVYVYAVNGVKKVVTVTVK